MVWKEKTQEDRKQTENDGGIETYEYVKAQKWIEKAQLGPLLDNVPFLPVTYHAVLTVTDHFLYDIYNDFGELHHDL